jgi:hypothetical protein
MISLEGSGKFAQKCKYGLNIIKAKLNKDVVKDLNKTAGEVRRYGEGAGTAKFQTFKDGTKVLTNTNGVPRLITIHDGQVAVKEGGKMKVISDQTFVRTYSPAYNTNVRYAGMGSSTAKSGTKSYFDICSDVIAKNDKSLSKTLKENNIEVLKYIPACDIKGFEMKGKVKLKINGVESEMSHNCHNNQVSMKQFLKDVLVDKKSNDVGGKYFEGAQEVGNDLKAFAQRNSVK